MPLTLPKTEPAAQQTAAGYAELKTIDTRFVFTSKEKEILRTLAKQVKEISQREEMAAKAKLWRAHNDLLTDTPLVFIDPENGWNEIIEVRALECVDPLARVWEMMLRKQIFWANEMKDDKVIEPSFDVPYSYTDSGYGIQPRKIGGGDGGAYHIEKVIEDYQKDFDKLRYPVIEIDEQQSAQVMELAQALFSDTLTVRRKNIWWWTLGLCQDYINLRGLEDFMCDFLIEPEYVHKMFDFLCTSKLKMLDFLETNNLLASNNEGTYVGSGGFGFTSHLPVKADLVTTRDMWGFCDAQETAQMSPELYAEFIFPYHTRILERFGLSCYGCCEGYDNRWKYVKDLPNLRRVSVSPWSKFETVPEYLGKNYIASVKPNPASLAFPNMDIDVVRKECRDAAEKTKGGICEFIMKDNNTLGGNAQNAIKWVEIMREEIDRIY
jgi:hypothetical protein